MSSRVQQLKDHIESGRRPDSFVPDDVQVNSDPPDRSPGRGDNVTVAQCNAIRCAAQDGKHASEIAALFDCLGSQSTVHPHATGVCTHDNNVEPVSTTKQITATDCQQMRSLYENADIRQRDIADAVGEHRSTVAYHLTGRCTHNHD